MTEADLFRQYAKEAMRAFSKSTNENEKQDLVELACIWAQAALTSERVFGSSFVRRRANCRRHIVDPSDRHPVTVEFTKTLDCGPNIRRRRRTAALTQRLSGSIPS